MKEDLILTIEGNSFSGKTVTAEKLREVFGIPIVREYFEYAEDQGWKFPKFPRDNFEDAKNAINFFLELEKRRSDDAIDLSARKHMPVVMDRSPFSCIVFEWTVSKRFPKTPSAYVYAIEKFQKAFDEGKIILPQGLVLLEPENDDIFLSRVKKRGRVDVQFLNDLETMQLMKSWYISTIDNTFPDSGLVLQTVEGDVELTARFLYEFIVSLNNVQVQQLGLSGLVNLK